MLTLTTKIPTAVRGAVRSLVKAHTDWPAFLAEKRLISAAAHNYDLIEFALRHPALAAQIDALLGNAPANAQTDGPETMMEDETGYEAAAAPQAAAPQGPYEIGELLAPMGHLMAPLMRQELDKILAPVIDAANRGPVEIERIVEVERVVEVAPGESPRKVAPKARRDKKTTFRTLFPSRGTKDDWLDAPLTLWTGVQAPAVDPFYVTVKKHMAAAMTAIERGANFWLVGPAGTGKSTLPVQAAAYLGRPIVVIQMTAHTLEEDLLGGMGLKDGNTVWVDGALTSAMRAPGTIILIDELTIAPAGVQAIIQHAASERRSIDLPTGEVVKAADGVVFCVADNTTGSGDEGGLYAGANISSAALVTRFGRMLHIDYLTVQQETEALANHTRCPVPAAQYLVEFVHKCRKLPTLQGVVLSLRQMVGFIQCIQDGFTAKDAFEMAISSRMPATERATIEASADLAWSTTFDALMQGKTAPVAPSNSAAANAFSDTINY